MNDPQPYNTAISCWMSKRNKNVYMNIRKKKWQI